MRLPSWGERGGFDVRARSAKCLGKSIFSCSADPVVEFAEVKGVEVNKVLFPGSCAVRLFLSNWDGIDSGR